MKRRRAPRPGAARDRGSVAALPAPAPLAHRTRPFIPAPVAPLRARVPKNHHLGADAPNGATQDREIVMTIIEQIETHEHSATAAACRSTQRATARRPSATSSTPAPRLGRRRCHRGGERAPSASSPRASAGRSDGTQRRRTREPAVGRRPDATDSRQADARLRDLQREQDASHRDQVPRSGAGCPPEFQLDAGSKFQGRSSRMRDCGWPAAIFSSVFVSQA